MKPNPNQALIDQVNALATEVQKLQPAKGPADPYLAQAVGGLHTTRDHLTWHGQEQLAREPKAATPAP
jgi:hypothetical protein